MGMGRFGNFITHTPIDNILPVRQFFFNGLMGAVFVLICIIKYTIIFSATPIIIYVFLFGCHGTSFLCSDTEPTQSGGMPEPVILKDSLRS